MRRPSTPTFHKKTPIQQNSHKYILGYFKRGGVSVLLVGGESMRHVMEVVRVEGEGGWKVAVVGECQYGCGARRIEAWAPYSEGWWGWGTVKIQLHREREVLSLLIGFEDMEILRLV
ncbi:hypothetical protein Tco_0490606 [Tanacetum coccineum]